MRNQQMLLRERLSQPATCGLQRAETIDELALRFAALDEAAAKSGAYEGALLVNFKPSLMQDSLALMHEHVLCRVKECA